MPAGSARENDYFASDKKSLLNKRLELSRPINRFVLNEIRL